MSKDALNNPDSLLMFYTFIHTYYFVRSPELDCVAV